MASNLMSAGKENGKTPAAAQQRQTDNRKQQARAEMRGSRTGRRAI